MNFLEKIQNTLYSKYFEASFLDIDDLKKTQHDSMYEIERFQYENIERFIRILIKDNSFWKEHIKKSGFSEKTEWTAQNFSALPIMNKAVYKQQSRMLYLVRRPCQRIYQDTTSGTSGVPWVFFTDNYSQFWRYILSLRSNIWAGYREGTDIFLQILMRPIPGAFRKGNFFSFKNRHSIIEAKDYFADLSVHKYLVAYGFVEFFRALSECIQTGILEPIHIRSVITCGETLTISERERFESVFKTVVYNSYSTREFGRIAQECKEKNGLHYHAERFLIEIVDAEGKKVPEGRMGKVIITDFYNFATPFLRFATEDWGYMATTRCRCGMTLPRLYFAEREIDKITVERGEINAHVLTGAFNKRTRYVNRYQIIQNTLYTFEVRVVPTEQYSIATWVGIREDLQKVLGEKALFSCVLTNHDALCRNGKYILFINEFLRKKNFL